LSAPVVPVTFKADGAAMECFLVPWDTEIFGFPVAQIGRLEIGEGADAGGVLRAFDGWCADQRVRLASCRLDHARLRESMALEEVGFRFVEMVHEPRLDLIDRIAAPRRVIQITEALEDDLAAIEEIAYSAFTTGRFLLDWRLPPELSRRRYAAWVRNSFRDPDHAVLKATADGELIGFFIVETRLDGSVYWHLTAIAPRWQGKGMGMSLWRTMLLRHRTDDATSVSTTISGHNPPALNLYARLGFKFGAAQMTFHRLTP
jgi:ribosomal protein S18 acetylase RimI-like enzyme